MYFCKGCGKTISILNHTEAEFCPACMPNKEPGKKPENTKAGDPALDAATLSVKNGRIILESPEGWLLWSGNPADNHSLETILTSATKILKIRKRLKE